MLRTRCGDCRRWHLSPPDEPHVLCDTCIVRGDPDERELLAFWRADRATERFVSRGGGS
jgi:hypothetical protein